MTDQFAIVRGAMKLTEDYRRHVIETIRETFAGSPVLDDPRLMALPTCELMLVTADPAGSLARLRAEGALP